MVGLVEIYLILGGFFGALHLWAKRRLEEKIETKDIAVATAKTAKTANGRNL